MRPRDILVPFSDEEIERLAVLAAADGGSVVDFIRACVFGPKHTSTESTEDLICTLADIEGTLIRSRRRGPGGE